LENELQVVKFHKLFYELHVALKATLPLDAEIKCPPEMTFGGLIEVKKENNVKRACMPAIVVGDASDGGRLLTFKQWFDPEGIKLFYQLCFQLKPTSKRPLQFREVLFGRANESQSFGFRPVSPYINLQFLRTDSFNPVFCRVQTDDGDLEFFVIQVGLSENGDAFMVATKTDSETVPEHLRDAKL